MPTPPASWKRGVFVVPEHRRRLLQMKNPHPRDERISFDEKPHEYWVDGIRVAWSATSLVSYFSGEFVPALVIDGMRRGRNWPRPGYVTLLEGKRRKIAEDLAEVLLTMGRMADAEACKAAGELSPPEVAAHGAPPHADALASIVQYLRPTCSAAEWAAEELADDDATILAKWEDNKYEAANRGHGCICSVNCG